VRVLERAVRWVSAAPARCAAPVSAPAEPRVALRERAASTTHVARLTASARPGAVQPGSDAPPRDAALRHGHAARRVVVLAPNAGARCAVPTDGVAATIVASLAKRASAARAAQATRSAGTGAAPPGRCAPGPRVVRRGEPVTARAATPEMSALSMGVAPLARCAVPPAAPTAQAVCQMAAARRARRAGLPAALQSNGA
jgi:hypothetical protein